MGGYARLALALLELSKFRLSLLVVSTTAVGYFLAAESALGWSRLALTLIGTALAAFGANAFNQCLEAPRDARMLRTRGRPLPSGRVSARAAWLFAGVVGLSGPALLLAVSPLAALLAAGCEALYVLVYTPLKVRTTLNTLVGAVVGAIPPLIGWAAAAGELAPGAWVLGAILFVWQIPHFLALAWLYREDYARGGFRMLPSADRGGERTCQAIVLFSLALVPVALMLTGVGATGLAYAAGAALLTAWLMVLAVRLYLDRSDARARGVFLASVIYLPLLLGLMVADRRVPAAGCSGGKAPPVVVAGRAHTTGVGS